MARKGRLVGGVEILLLLVLLVTALLMDTAGVVALLKGPVAHPDPQFPGATAETYAIGIAMLVLALPLTVAMVRALIYRLRTDSTTDPAPRRSRTDAPPWEHNWQP